eukprot:1965572-Alexandrium_andersonii.AAC.1
MRTDSYASLCAAVHDQESALLRRCAQHWPQSTRAPDQKPCHAHNFRPAEHSAAYARVPMEAHLRVLQCAPRPQRTPAPLQSARRETS